MRLKSENILYTHKLTMVEIYGKIDPLSPEPEAEEEYGDEEEEV